MAGRSNGYVHLYLGRPEDCDSVVDKLEELQRKLRLPIREVLGIALSRLDTAINDGEEIRLDLTERMRNA